jgi:hypothetical protein
MIQNDVSKLTDITGSVLAFINDNGPVACIKTEVHKSLLEIDFIKETNDQLYNINKINDLDERARVILFDINQTTDQLKWNMDTAGVQLLKAQTNDLLDVINQIKAYQRATIKPTFVITPKGKEYLTIRLNLAKII